MTHLRPRKSSPKAKVNCSLHPEYSTHNEKNHGPEMEIPNYRTFSDDLPYFHTIHIFYKRADILGGWRIPARSISNSRTPSSASSALKYDCLDGILGFARDFSSDTFLSSEKLGLKCEHLMGSEAECAIGRKTTNAEVNSSRNLDIWKLKFSTFVSGRKKR